MILGIGTDIVSAGRIEELIVKFGDKFLNRIFSQNEIKNSKAISNSSNNTLLRSLFFAKRFAAKEAFSKAIGLGIGRGIDFKDIEVQNNSLGKPEIKILNGKEQFLIKHFKCNNIKIDLSLSDENPLATAFVVISGE